MKRSESSRQTTTESSDKDQTRLLKRIKRLQLSGCARCRAESCRARHPQHNLQAQTGRVKSLFKTLASVALTVGVDVC